MTKSRRSFVYGALTAAPRQPAFQRLCAGEARMKAFFAILIVIGASVNSENAIAQKSSNLQADRIQISYVPPKNPDHEAIFQQLKERRVLEKFQGFLSPLRLPRTLLLKVEGCGESNGWYENDAITVCYEYIEEIFGNAPKETTPAGITRTDAIIGPIVETFLHELGTPCLIITPCRF